MLRLLFFTDTELRIRTYYTRRCLPNARTLHFLVSGYWNLSSSLPTFQNHELDFAFARAVRVGAGGHGGRRTALRTPLRLRRGLAAAGR
jgi:hypothetical protein